MNVKSMTPVLRTWDLAGSREFYEQVLGFKCDVYEPEAGWAMLTYGAGSIMLTGPNEHEGDRGPAFTGSLYFRIDDADDLWARLKDQVRICYPIETFEYGMREFAIYDGNGYLLQFGQAVHDG